METSHRPQPIRDLALIVGMSVVVGYGFNALRKHPFPLRYLPRTVAETAAPGAASSVQPISVERLKSVDRSTMVFIDARAPLFFQRSHAPGAINIAKQYYIRDLAIYGPALDRVRGREIVVYCSCADCEDSAFVARELVRAGHTKVQVLDGGWKAWQEAGLPEEKR